MLTANHSPQPHNPPPPINTPPPIETPPSPTETVDLIGLVDHMDDKVPGANKRQETPSHTATDEDQAMFHKVLNALDEKIRLADKDEAIKIRQTKNFMISYQKGAVDIYNATFDPEQWIVAPGKKTRANRLSSLKLASSESGQATQTS